MVCHLLVHDLLVTGWTDESQHLDEVSYSLMQVDGHLRFATHVAAPGAHLVLHALPTVEDGAISVCALTTFDHYRVADFTNKVLKNR
jgi:hypothetical protein